MVRIGAMNAFSDLVVSFGDDRRPVARRLENDWEHAADGPGAVWRSRGSAGAAPTRGSVSVPGASAWVIGEVFSYRSSSRAPEERLVRDVVAGRGDDLSSLDAHAVVVIWDAAA